MFFLIRNCCNFFSLASEHVLIYWILNETFSLICLSSMCNKNRKVLRTIKYYTVCILTRLNNSYPQESPAQSFSLQCLAPSPLFHVNRHLVPRPLSRANKDTNCLGHVSGHVTKMGTGQATKPRATVRNKTAKRSTKIAINISSFSSRSNHRRWPKSFSNCTVTGDNITRTFTQWATNANCKKDALNFVKNGIVLERMSVWKWCLLIGF